MSGVTGVLLSYGSSVGPLGPPSLVFTNVDKFIVLASSTYSHVGSVDEGFPFADGSMGAITPWNSSSTAGPTAPAGDPAAVDYGSTSYLWLGGMAQIYNGPPPSPGILGIDFQNFIDDNPGTTSIVVGLGAWIPDPAPGDGVYTLTFNPYTGGVLERPGYDENSLINVGGVAGTPGAVTTATYYSEAPESYWVYFEAPYYINVILEYQVSGKICSVYVMPPY